MIFQTVTDHKLKKNEFLKKNSERVNCAEKGCIKLECEIFGRAQEAFLGGGRGADYRREKEERKRTCR